MSYERLGRTISKMSFKNSLSKLRLPLSQRSWPANTYYIDLDPEIPRLNGWSDSNIDSIHRSIMIVKDTVKCQSEMLRYIYLLWYVHTGLLTPFIAAKQ